MAVSWPGPSGECRPPCFAAGSFEHAHKCRIRASHSHPCEPARPRRPNLSSGLPTALCSTKPHALLTAPPHLPHPSPGRMNVLSGLQWKNRSSGRGLVRNGSALTGPRSTLLLLPSCPLCWQMRGRAPLWSSAAHLLPTGCISTCSLVNILVAFLSTPRSSPPHQLREQPM